VSPRALAVVLAAPLLPLGLFLAAERRLAGAAGLPLDDAWIHAHFARNLAEGAGFAYNPGVPVAGSTAPLWTLLLAGAFLLAGPSLAAIKALGVATALGAALATHAAARAWGATPASALAAAVALAWTGALAWGALSGMEVTLAALLVALALRAHARGRAGATARWAALAALARPEALVPGVLLAAAGPHTWRRAAIFTGTALGVLGPWVAFSLATVGAPVPATAAAKVEGGLLGWVTGRAEPWGQALLARPAAFAGEWVGWLATTHWALPVALGPALALAWRRGGRTLGLPALALVAHPLAMAVLAPYRGPGFQEGRYSIHLLPLAFVLLGGALDALPRAWRRPALVGWLALALATLPAAAARYGWAVQNINAMQVHLGHWVDRHVPAGARLALNDVGAIAWVSRREVIDLMGLVTPEVIPYRRAGEAALARYLGRACPDYVIVFPTWFPELTRRRDLLEPLYRVALPRPTVVGGPEMVVYRFHGCAR